MRVSKAWLGSLLLSACTGNISLPGGSDSHTSQDSSRNGSTSFSDNSTAGTGSGGSGTPTAGGGTGTAAVGEAITPAAGSRAMRLTHLQYANTVQDLLGLPLEAVDQGILRDDARQAGFIFDNNGGELIVDEALLSGYERLAADLAQQATASTAAMERVSAAQQPADWLSDFLLRAHRKPLSDADTAAYQALFQQYGGEDDFETAAAAVIEAALQSPYFLYRTELSDGGQERAAVALSSYEVASRLSYALWNTLPDAELFAAARQDALLEPAEVEAQARRMLADERAADLLVTLHDQLLETEKFANISPSAVYYQVAADFASLVHTEQTLFIQHLLFDQQGSLRDLLTSTDSFVNDELAEVYGLAGDFGADFEQVSLAVEERAGVFTHLGFLAANASSVDPDPIHRGKFLAERMACIEIAAPPPDLPPAPEGGDMTNRARIESFTEVEGTACAACHKPLINPFGFPFESYDAIGAYRTTDRNMPVDTRTSPLIDGAATPVADALELVQSMADSEGVHRCYARHLVEFVFGRPQADEDAGLIAQLATRSLQEDLPVTELIVDIVTSEAFMTRKAEAGL